MVRGLYTSALGMITQMNRMDVVANNIANADTTGYKRDIAVTRSFSEELFRRLDDATDIRPNPRIGPMTLGIFVDDIHTDYATGSFRTTNGNLDLAVSGAGFFVVQATDANGNTIEKYTRDGAFTLAQDGSLMTKDGYRVMGENGPIVLPHGTIGIDESGFIYVNDQLTDRLRLVDFTNPTSLRKTGDNLWAATPESDFRNFSAKVMQGVLENSNVNSVKEMVEMITLSRVYEANSRLVMVHDNTLGKAVNEIARR